MAVQYTKFTLVTVNAGEGDSETLWTTGGSPSQVTANINAYLKARMLIHSDATVALGVRVAIEGSPRGSVLVRPPGGPLPGGGGTILVPKTGGYATYLEKVPLFTPWRQCLQVAFQYNGVYQANRYFSDIPKAVVGSEPQTWLPNGNVSWGRDLGALLQLMTGGQYYIKALLRDDKYAALPVSKLAVSGTTPSLLGIVVAGNLGTQFNPPARVLLQHFRPAKGTRGPTINGQYTVDSTVVSGTPPVTTIFLANSQTIDPSAVQIRPSSTISLWGKGIVALTNYRIQQVVSHKRGKPSVLPRGRVLTRATLDG